MLEHSIGDLAIHFVKWILGAIERISFESDSSQAYSIQYTAYNIQHTSTVYSHRSSMQPLYGPVCCILYTVLRWRLRADARTCRLYIIGVFIGNLLKSGSSSSYMYAPEGHTDGSKTIVAETVAAGCALRCFSRPNKASCSSVIQCE